MQSGTIGQGTPVQADGRVVALSEKLAAALGAGDAATLEAIADADFTYIDESGRVHPRHDVISGGRRGSSASELSRTVKDYGSVAMVTGRSRSAGQGEVVALDVWVKDGEEWRVLIHHLNVLADAGSPSAHPAPVPRPPEARPPDCSNPCDFVPYEPKSESERGIIAAFQALESAVINNDADDWVNYMADEFVVYRTKQHPTTKARRAGHLREQKHVNAETFVAAVEAMTLWVYGDAAVMRADHVMPANRRPPYRATRIWVKRDGRWQMAVSQQTTRAI